ncbi:hybrid sensor histidine kinase/response regulator transcription factor [Poritiphilus flavus]|uniref:histidine kinase n=1 Tax=Poritiphilus flavus TaxID=2697053 RepID=A0A6L9E816_9FLAO|nr:tetratricopeptide repeat protein [Poritiphilus flavus]NAS10877.1 tetratricopeptide repeat protein [Poritiphilus flavus]
MKRSVFLFLLFFAYLGFSQSKVDSLYKKYTDAVTDSVKVKRLHQLFEEYKDNEPQNAKVVILEAIDRTQNSRLDRLEVMSYNHYADYLRTQSEDDSALIVNKKAMDLSLEMGFLKGQSKALAGLGVSYARMGNFEDARKYLNENLALTERLGDSLGMADTYITLGTVHTQNIEYTEAMELYTRASEIYRKFDDKGNLSKALGNIGFVHRSMGNYNKAKDYFIQSDEIAKEINLKRQRAFCSYNMSIVYRNTGDLDRAIASNAEAIKIYAELGNRKRVSFGQFTMGKIYWEKEDYEQSLDYYQRSLEISQEVHDSVNIGHSYENIGKCLHKLGRNAEAKANLAKAMEVADRIGLKVLAMNTHEILADVHSEDGDYQEAYTNMNAYATLRNDLYTREKVDLANDIEAKYQNEQKSREIALLESEKELQTLQLNKRVNERNGIIAFSLIMLVLAALLYNQYRIKQNANRKLKELDRMKSNFFANISHEFRTPLTLIKGPIEHLEQNPDEKLGLEEIKMIRRNATRVLKLVNQLLDLSRIDTGNLKLEPTEGDVFKCLRAAASSFNSHAAQRAMDYRVHIPHTALWASFDRDKLEKIVYNLLSNAFKFSEDGSVITLEVNYREQELQLKVSDSGKGIPDDQLLFIFDRFYQVDSSATKEHEGSGIGLSLSRDLVEMMDGTITVSSELHKGSFFTVHLPIQEIRTGRETDAKIHLPANKIPSRAFEFSKKDARDLPGILLVEDNSDMRNFIQKSLIENYRVNTAVNGKQGLNKAIQDPPDLIITDLMMPKMDGIELCKSLKTDVNTSHIPVIMLTAKAGMDNKIEGLETGADDYLTKPFDAKELLVRIKNLITQRQKLRELYTNREVQVDPRKITVTSVDQKFLEKVLDLMENRHADAEFGVPQMQEALAMSKTQLHRKLKALTNEAPGELLRNFRLKRAAQLLSQKADSVTQIAYGVGFNNLSYFAKCFKELYGVAPSTY